MHTHQETFARFAPHIAALPPTARLEKTDLLTPTFRLVEEGALAVYYAPFHPANPDARVAIVGITPGWTQFELAHRVAREGLWAGLAPEVIWQQVKATASFAGAMRRNLVMMLDGIGLPAALGIGASAELFTDRHDLLARTSAVKDAVFIAGQNYTGGRPPLLATPVLRRYAEEVLAPELAALPEALVIPLGTTVADVLVALSEQGLIDLGRCLLGFPHPSPANGHRHRHYRERQEALQQRVTAWFAAHPVAPATQQ